MYELGLTSQLIRKVVILRPLILFYFFISISNGSYDKNCRQGASDYWLTCTEIFNIISKTRYNFVSFCFPLHEVGYCDWSIMEIVSCRRLWKWYSKFLMTICHNYHLWKMNDIKRLYLHQIWSSWIKIMCISFYIPSIIICTQTIFLFICS